MLVCLKAERRHGYCTTTTLATREPDDVGRMGALKRRVTSTQTYSDKEAAARDSVTQVASWVEVRPGSSTRDGREVMRAKARSPSLYGSRMQTPIRGLLGVGTEVGKTRDWRGGTGHTRTRLPLDRYTVGTRIGIGFDREGQPRYNE